MGAVEDTSAPHRRGVWTPGPTAALRCDAPPVSVLAAHLAAAPLAADPVGAVVGALVLGLAGLATPRVVAALPRARDVPAGTGGPDYRALAVVRGLRLWATVVGVLLGALLGWRLGLLTALPWLHLVGTGLALSWVDLREHRLPDALVLPSLVVAPALVAVLSLARGQPGSLARALLGMAVSWTVSRLLHAVSPTGLGRGDVKLAAWTGLVTAWLSWPSLVVGFVAAVGLGGVAAVVVLVRGGSRRTAIPFGPFLLGGAVVATFSAPLTGWYLTA